MYVLRDSTWLDEQKNFIRWISISPNPINLSRLLMRWSFPQVFIFPKWPHSLRFSLDRFLFTSINRINLSTGFFYCVTDFFCRWYRSDFCRLVLFRSFGLVWFQFICGVCVCVCASFWRSIAIFILNGALFTNWNHLSTMLVAWYVYNIYIERFRFLLFKLASDEKRMRN